MLAGIFKSIALGGLNALFGTIGKTVTDIHTSTTARQANENAEGGKLAGQYVAAHGADADRRKGPILWFPFGLPGFIIAMAIAFHVTMIILDTTSWHLAPTLKWYVVPWLEWRPHTIGSWGIEKLPGKLEELEHDAIRALLYVGPPSAALMLLARAFRR